MATRRVPAPGATGSPKPFKAGAAVTTARTAPKAVVAGIGQRAKPEPKTVQEWIGRALTDPEHAGPVIAALLVAELVLNIAIVLRVPYTEIDWIAYMQEVGGVIGGEYDYANLRGDTGPLVYPAGFVYVYTVLYWVTAGGVHIRRAQWIFAGLYLATHAIVLQIYRRTRIFPPWALVLLCVSKRVHSIFVLRLFNDPIAMLLLYAAVLLAMQNRWTLASLGLTLAVSIKMNVLLFVPAYGMLLVERFGAVRTIPHVLLCVAVQVVLAIPFLARNAASYVAGAFDFGRQFFYIWTVNLKFLPEELFLDRRVAAGLLAAHVAVLALFFFTRWSRFVGGVLPLLKDAPSPTAANLPPARIATVMFTSNLIGVTFARSLHYQFYAWYFHTLPYLFWRSRLGLITRLIMLGAIELCWNVFPATAWSSALLWTAHIVLLASLWLNHSAPELAPTALSVRGRHALPDDD